MIGRLNFSLALEDLAIGGRFLWSLPSFLRRPIGLDEARWILRRRLERREADFLSLARGSIYSNPVSPYRELLGLAGCEYGDLEALVRQEGLERALYDLYRRGVYLSVSELKGRQSLVRGSTTLSLDPTGLWNRASSLHALAHSGGSRGGTTLVPIDLTSLRDRAVNTALVFDARGAAGWRHAIWGVPGGSIGPVLRLSACGAPPARWFWLVDANAPGLHPRYRWSARVLGWGGVLARVPVPRPEHVPVERSLEIAGWMARVLQEGSTPDLFSYVGPAVRLCRAALEAGLDLRGARFLMFGEPLTRARLATVRRTGADALPTYGTVETGGPVAEGCQSPAAPDEVHLFHDLYALVQPGSGGEQANLPRDALLLSAVRPTAPYVLLNVSMGDQAVANQRACGCPLEQLGWTTHLHTIRSYEKLTAGGMTFLDTDVIRVLEEDLPSRFGGGATDYQLLEEEDEEGRTSVRLLVDPSVGPLDDKAVAETFLQAIGRGSGAQRVMELQWRQAGVLVVERRPPLSTASGKILHLHQGRRSGTA